MRQKVQDTIGKFHMFPKGAKIIAGFSGGADSAALLHVLCSLRDDWEITAVHIHHGLRGEDADRDALFAEAFCRDLGIPCIVKKYDVKAEAEKYRMGEEEMGRHLRYAAFREAAGEDGLIAVAHHRRDQAETVLMRLCRGTGLKGLTAMAPVRDKICRPLLFCSREEIEQYCREHALQWREDASNQEVKYTRNRLRLQVLPVLEKINPKAEAHIAETAELLAAEEDYLEQQASACYQSAAVPGAEGDVCLKKEALLHMHPAMRRRVLRKAISVFLETDVSQAQIEAMEDLLGKETGKSRNFPEGICAENRYETLVLSMKKEKTEGYCYALPLGETISVPEGGISVIAWLSEKAEKVSENTKCFDYEKIRGELFCRTRKTGDVIPLKKGRKRMKDLFIDEKVPRAERETLPLIAVDEEVLWAVGLRVSQTHAADENTKTYLYIRIEKA